MEVLQDAAASLRRNAPAVLAYTAIATVLVIADRAVSVLCFGAAPPEAPPAWYPYFNLARQAALAAAMACAQAVVFARIGKAIDRPLWKCAGDTDALRRFFVPWFLVQLMLIAFEQFYVNAMRSGAADLELLTGFLHLAVWVTSLPIGACVMYHGRLDWSQLGEALAPIASHPREAAAALFVLAGQYMLYLALAAAATALLGEGAFERAVVLPVLLIVPPLAVLDGLAFCAMWRVCMMHRDHAFYEDPYDF